ncbi:hypothetical protein UFOVP431_64 [uncultured Caudovirales phage]|uniref:Uncharacterized protein n=1 Tax=uncultured Caudovirales phage TaxID=2100421 RepID=A0A6J5MPJ4_9CAUD|nr:hypothetical protein UFOVP431_64 [uncultured Caudovirales phage]
MRLIRDGRCLRTEAGTLGSFSWVQGITATTLYPLKLSNVLVTMAQEVQVKFTASSDFVDRLEELSASVGVSKADVIKAAIDILEMVAAADREGKAITFTPKELNTKRAVDVVFIGGPADGMRKRLEGRDSSALPAQLSYSLEPLPPCLYPPRLYVEVRFREAVYIRCFRTQGMGGEPVYRWRGNE